MTSPNSYYMLIADDTIQLGSTVPNYDDKDRPFAAHQDPRTIDITEALDDRVRQYLPDIVIGKVSPAVRVVRVTPRGVVSVHEDYAEPGAEVSEHIALQAEGGWTVEAIVPLQTIFGPQGEFLLAAIRTGIEHLDNDGEIGQAYSAEVDHLYDIYRLHDLRCAAEEAMWAAHADGYWWSRNAFGCVWGQEMLALAARDLIGTTAEWTQDAYDILTRPWRTAFPATPLHPDDKPLPVAVAAAS